ncbi:putative RNA-directed DNA polymerase [Tanacetum coccineum]
MFQEEYRCYVKTTNLQPIRQSPTAFSELHALLIDHDYMLGKTCAAAPFITSSFAANYAVCSPSMPEARQAQLSELTAQLSALGFQLSPIVPSGPQAFYGALSSKNTRITMTITVAIAHNTLLTTTHRGCGKRLYIARHVRFNEAQFPFDIPKTTSPPPSKTSPYYSLESPYVIPTTDHPSLSSPRSPISSPSSVSHLSLTSQTSLESSSGQPSPVSTTSIPTPPPPTPPPHITRQRPANFVKIPNNGFPTILSQIMLPVKQDKNDSITRYKARFVAKGFRQQPGFIDPQRPNHVCLLHKSLYGLKQASRAWFERLSKALFDLGFKGSKTDPSLFIYSRGDTLLYILVYVDDIIVTGNNKGTIDNIICQLGFAFALKDLGPLNYFLGIEIVPHVSGILLSQKKYILELLQSAGLSNCNLVSSPMVTSSSLNLDDSTAFSNPVKYRQVVGSLQYVTLSGPGIAFAVNKVCQYMHAPTENHWSAVKRILRYLHGMVEHDADWAGDSDDRRSTEGFAIYLGSNLISWTTRKQRTVSRSSTEAEYKALADTVTELTWLQALLHELGIRSSSTPILWCDNLGATYLSANPIFRARTKHVEIDYHFVRKKVAQGDLRVQHISTHDQIADIFTKPLPTPRFLFLRSKLQVVARP